MVSGNRVDELELFDFDMEIRLQSRTHFRRQFRTAIVTVDAAILQRGAIARQRFDEITILRLFRENATIVEDLSQSTFFEIDRRVVMPMMMMVIAVVGDFQ